MPGLLDFLAAIHPEGAIASYRKAQLLKGMQDAGSQALYGDPAANIPITPPITQPGQFQQRQQAGTYNAPSSTGGVLNAVPEAQRPFLEGMSAAFGPQAAIKQAYETNVPKVTGQEDQYEPFNAQHDPYGLGGVGQRNTRTGQILDYQKPDKPVGPLSPIARLGQDLKNGLITKQQFDEQLQRQSGLLPQGVFDQKVKLVGAEADARSKAQMASDEQQEAQAQAIANYQQAPLTGYAAARPQGIATMARVMQIRPDYRAQNYKMSTEAQSRFASGPQGNTIRSFNVGISHLGTLARLGEALGNGDVQAVNSIRNAARAQFGAAVPVEFDAVKGIVSDEILKAIIGGGAGAVFDREEFQSKLNRANSWPQLSSVIKDYKELMAGQLRGLSKQYESSTFLKNFNDKLLPETVQELESLQMAPQGGRIPFANAPAGGGFKYLGKE